MKAKFVELEMIIWRSKLQIANVLAGFVIITVIDKCNFLWREHLADGSDLLAIEHTRSFIKSCIGYGHTIL